MQGRRIFRRCEAMKPRKAGCSVHPALTLQQMQRFLRKCRPKKIKGHTPQALSLLSQLPQALLKPEEDGGCRQEVPLNSWHT